MKLPLKIIVIGAILALIPACQEKKMPPLPHGFSFSSKWIGVDSGPSAKLYYQGPNADPVLIWPFFGVSGSGSSAIYSFTNDMAFFLADMPDDKGRLGAGAYFAAQAPGPALDISEDVLKVWAEMNHLDFQTVRGNYGPLLFDIVTNGMKLHFIGDEKLPADIVLNWQQISNIIQDVKQNGEKHVIAKPHAEYLRKNYGPEKHYDLPR